MVVASRRAGWLAVGSGLVALALAGCVAASGPPTPSTQSLPPASAVVPTAAAAATTSASATVSATSPPVVEVPATVRLDGAANFRDLAGDGTQLGAGAHLARGVVYRSGKLSELTAADLTALRGLGLSEILDLRTPDVAARAPDPKLPGVRVHLMNLYGTARSVAMPQTSVAAVRSRLRELNRAFVTDPDQRHRLRNVLERIASASGPVVIHCTDGKDRTGWVSAMLQYVAGADDATVLASYLESNTYRAAQIRQEYAARKAAKGAVAAELYRAQALVRADYLGAGLAAARSRYGSVDAYLRDGVGLSQATVDALRAKLVVG